MFPSFFQDLFRRVRSILNKLTPQMFQQLMKQVMELSINTEERLKGVIDLIFEKAISEPNFSVAYANMCRCLMGVSAARATVPLSSPLCGSGTMPGGWGGVGREGSSQGAMQGRRCGWGWNP